MNIKYSEEDIKFLEDNYPSRGFEFCQEKLKIPKDKLKSKIIRMSLKLCPDTRSELYRKVFRTTRTKDNKDYSVNPEQFYNVKAPEVAYILGLLWADGYILGNTEKSKKTRHVVRFGVQLEDFKYFIKILNKTGKWNIYKRNLKNRKPQGQVEISNRPLVEYLYTKKYKSKSSDSACHILETIPEHLKHYWFRGLLDGDGCIYISKDNNHIKLSISSSYEQDWKYMEELFKLFKDNHYKIHRIIRPNGNKYSVFEITKRTSIIGFCEYIYNNYDKDRIGLPRKHDKYLKVLIMENEPQRKPRIDSKL